VNASRLAACLALALLALPARADFKDTYRKAFEAVERKRWSDVVAQMRRAIAENPSEGAAIKLYGMRFEPYLPHFHLGFALAQTGQCAEAVKEFEISESQGVVRSSPYFNQLLSAKAECQRVAGPVTPPRPLTPPPTTAAPTTTTTAPAPTTTLAPTTTTLRALPVTPTRSATPAAPPPTASPPPVRSSPAPPELVRAAEAYFAGRYDEAVSLLDRITGLSGRPAAHAHLLRAAARFALFRIGGERDAQLRQRALQDVSSCRGADPALVPDPEAFPPSFAELFRSGR
jgi:hypothetical protein